MKAYKGFNPDMTCRDFQYKEGETYTQDAAAWLCQTGFHAVLMPLDVLKYYAPGKGSVYHEVDVDDVDAKREEDTKVAGRVIKIGASLTLPALIQAQVDFVFANSKKVAGATSKAKNAQVGTDIANGAATASGDSGAATASGYSGAATASGYSGAATASGRYGAATASGYYAAATASGYSGAATASGDSGAATASGKDGRARGAIGNAIFLAERDADWKIINVAAVIVDGKKVKADTFYKLVAGKVVAA